VNELNYSNSTIHCLILYTPPKPNPPPPVSPTTHLMCAHRHTDSKHGGLLLPDVEETRLSGALFFHWRVCGVSCNLPELSTPRQGVPPAAEVPQESYVGPAVSLSCAFSLCTEPQKQGLRQRHHRILTSTMLLASQLLLLSCASGKPPTRYLRAPCRGVCLFLRKIPLWFCLVLLERSRVFVILDLIQVEPETFRVPFWALSHFKQLSC